MKLYWSITNACNLQCRYCYYNSGLEDRVLTTSEVDNLKIVDDIGRNFKEVVFTGGEALLHPQIFTLIEKLKGVGIQVSILSNAVIMSEQTANRLIGLKVDDIAISLDSLDEELNDFLRGKTSLVKKGIETLINLRPEKMGLEIMMTITRKNILSIKPLVDFCHNNKLNLWLDPVEIDCKVTNLAELRLKDMNENELLELEDAANYWAGENATLRDYVINMMSLIKKEKPKKIECPMGSESYVMDPDGNLYPCFMRKDILIGNLFENKVEDVLKNPKLLQQKDGLKKAVCVRLGCVCMTIASSYQPYVQVNT